MSGQTSRTIIGSWSREMAVMLIARFDGDIGALT